MQFDGFTDVLTARAVVQCGQTYHIKLALCDANDSALDSGIFLQRNSFSSNLVVQVSLNLNVAGPNGDTMFENCGDGYIIFERPQSGNVNTELVAYLEYTGTAVNGVDYTLLPDSVVFPPGTMSVNLYVDAFADGLNEGVETVHMEIANIAECGESLVSSSFDFFISDIADPLVVEDVAIEMCQGETVTLEPVITGGYAVYNYSWSTGASTPTIDVSPPNTTTYFLTVSDTCGMPSDNGQFAVTVIQTPVLTVSLYDQDGINPMPCNGWGTLYASANGGVLPYDYSFADENGNLWSFDNTVSVSSWNAGWIYVEVEDVCGFTATDSIELTITAPPLFVTIPDTTFANCGEDYSVVVQASGGDTQGFGYNYSWMVDGAWDWNFFSDTYTGTANAPVTITAMVSDQCGQTEEASTQLVILSPDITVSLADSLFGTCATVHNITPILTGGSGDQNTWTYQWTANNQVVGNAGSYTSTFSNDQLITFYVADQCGQNAEDEVMIIVENPLLTIDLGEDIQASCIDQTALTVDTQGGSGGFQYTWMVGNQVEGTLATYTVQTYETIDVLVTVDDACGESDQDTITIFIPSEPLSIVAYPDTAICPGNSALVGVDATGGEGPYTMFWNSQWYGQELSVTPEATTSYGVVVTDICGRTLQENVLVEVKPITANFSIEPLGDNHYQFTANPIPACDLCNTYWEFGDGSESMEWAPLHHFDGLDNYTTQLTMINEIGCTNSQTYLILSPPYFYIPNSFTPNGD
ncbi:MAG: choice-of-anchor L domain-containing protein, partial [Flavobacteriales bacterium]